MGEPVPTEFFTAFEGGAAVGLEHLGVVLRLSLVGRLDANRRVAAPSRQVREATARPLPPAPDRQRPNLIGAAVGVVTHSLVVEVISTRPRPLEAEHTRR